MSRNTDFIPFARPAIGREEERAVISVLRSGWLTTGREAKKFEEEFAAYVGAGYALAVSSATAGLHLSLEALGVKANSLVVTTPYTFAASAEVIRYLGADPFFVDIEEDSFNLSPENLEKALAEQGDRVSAILPVHIAGLPCSMAEILEHAGNYKLPVVEDGAHIQPAKCAEMGGGYAGALEGTRVYSFYSTKTITTGEGGMVATDRQEVAERIRLMRLHGIDREVWDRYTSRKPSWYYQVEEAGFKYNLTDLAAAIGRVQLRKAAEFLKARKRIAGRYLAAFSALDYLKTQQYSEAHSWHLFLLRIAEDRLSIGRDAFVNELQERGIGVSVHFIPLHIMPYYRRRYGYRENDFPTAFENFRTSLSLPIYPGLTDEEAERVIEAVKEIGSKYYQRRSYGA